MNSDVRRKFTLCSENFKEEYIRKFSGYFEITLRFNNGPKQFINVSTIFKWDGKETNIKREK